MKKREVEKAPKLTPFTLIEALCIYAQKLLGENNMLRNKLQKINKISGCKKKGK